MATNIKWNAPNNLGTTVIAEIYTKSAPATLVESISLSQNVTRNNLYEGASTDDLTGDYLVSLKVSSSLIGTSLIYDAVASGTSWIGDLSENTVAVSGAGVPGGIEYTNTLTESEDGDPIANANVWCTSDSDGSTVIDTDITDDAGSFTFLLSPSTTYYLWAKASGRNSIQGTLFTTPAS